MNMFYIDKKDFDERFNLKGNIINNLLRVQVFYKDFYYVSYDQEIYDRFKKILKLAPNKTIHKYIKMIDYSRKHDLHFKGLMKEIGMREIMTDIDKHILENLMRLASKKIMGKK